MLALRCSSQLQLPHSSDPGTIKVADLVVAWAGPGWLRAEFEAGEGRDGPAVTVTVTFTVTAIPAAAATTTTTTTTTRPATATHLMLPGHKLETAVVARTCDSGVRVVVALFGP